MVIEDNQEFNDMQEVNAVTIKRADGKIMPRHPSDIIIFLHAPEMDGFAQVSEVISNSNETVQELITRPHKAKSDCKERILWLTLTELV